MQQSFSASRLFTGEAWLDNASVTVRNGSIESIVPGGRTSEKDFEDSIIVPAFVDLQVYGAGGRLLSLYPSADTLQLMYETFRSEGTCLFLPTVATNTPEVFRAVIDAVRAYWKNGGAGVAGIHLEGPWLHPDRRGAHVREWIHPPTRSEVQALLDYGKGIIKMITVAPEVVDNSLIDLMRSYGIVVSAGHSNADYYEAFNSFDRGIATVTHLYNAMSPLHHRAPGLTGAALLHHTVRASIIPDGHHVDYAAITLAKKIMGERLFAITDAVTDTADGPYRHQLAGDKYECNGVLSGSALSMHQAFVNLVLHAGIEWGEALRMCSLYPAQVLGVDDRYGKIAPGYAGQLLVLDKELAFVCVISAGDE